MNLNLFEFIHQTIKLLDGKIEITSPDIFSISIGEKYINFFPDDHSCTFTKNKALINKEENIHYLELASPFIQKLIHFWMDYAEDNVFIIPHNEIDIKSLLENAIANFSSNDGKLFFSEVNPAKKMYYLLDYQIRFEYEKETIKYSRVVMDDSLSYVPLVNLSILEKIKQGQGPFVKQSKTIDIKNRAERLLREEIMPKLMEEFEKSLCTESNTESECQCESALQYNISIKLLNILAIEAPTIIAQLNLEHKEKIISEKIIIDIFRNKLGYIQCHSCGERSTNIEMCSEGHFTCNKCYTNCHHCKCPICYKHSEICYICENDFCEEHIYLCDCLNIYYCLEHSHTCSICKQSFSKAAITKGICTSCIKPQSVPEDNVKLKHIFNIFPSISKLKNWEFNTTKKRIVFQKKTFLYHFVIVLNRDNDSVEEAYVKNKFTRNEKSLIKK